MPEWTNELNGCALSNCIVFRDTDNDDDSFGSCACLQCKSHSEYNACLYTKRDFLLLFFVSRLNCFLFLFIFFFYLFPVYVHNSLWILLSFSDIFVSLNIFDFMYSVLSVRFLYTPVCVWMWCGFCVWFFLAKLLFVLNVCKVLVFECFMRNEKKNKKKCKLNWHKRSLFKIYWNYIQ